MKPKKNARQKREDERKTAEVKKAPVFVPPEPVPAQSAEEETREFLEYLDRYHGPVMKDEDVPLPGRKCCASGGIARLNLEEGMPLVEEALDRMNLGLQEMRVRRVRVVKLIHGYGSTGRGGKICVAVRNELAAMRRKKQIREYIPGEHFGPLDTASRKLAESEKGIVRDPDYGRMNHGITIVVL